jgi:hypothetical protein
MLQPEWINGLVGGLLIGLSAAIYMLGAGRIAGMTGIVAQATGQRRDRPEPLSLAFLVGALAGAGALTLALGAPDIAITASVPALVVSGLVVGIGARLGNGCTSGHGVCGMSRLSARSIAATLTFMAATAITVAVLRHGLGMELTS